MVVRTGQPLGVAPLAQRVVLVEVDELQDDDAVGQAAAPVSTESVIRCLADSRLTSRSTTTSMECFSCFFSIGGSVSGYTTPSIRARE